MARFVPGKVSCQYVETFHHAICSMSRWSASPAWIETDLVRYPDIPLLTTDEVAALFAGEPRVTGTGISNSDLKEVTEVNFGQLLDSATLPDPGEVAAAGVTASALVSLWPFTLAYLSGRISDEQLGAAFNRVLGDSGVVLAAR